MPDSLSIGSAFIIGLLGTTHCLAMCGGIASSLSFGTNTDKPAFSRLLSYNLGRILSYCAAGLIIGLIGAGIHQTPFAPMLRVMAGLLLISMGLYIAQWWQGITRIEKVGSYLWRYIAPLMKPLMPPDNCGKSFLLGIGWGWLPCGLVYSTLLWSSAAGDLSQSVLLMFGFGLGTLPSMLLTGLLAQQVRTWIQNSKVRAFSGVILILMGIWTLPWAVFLSQGHIH